MAPHTPQSSNRIFHAGMKGLMAGAIVGGLVALLLLGAHGALPGIAFGGGIGWLAGMIAARRPELAHIYNGPERRHVSQGYDGRDRRHR